MRPYLTGIAVSVATLMLALPTLSAADRPNVLFICVDDLKPNLGCYEDKLAKTPNIDKLALRGMIFDRAYCNQAVCSPSRNALLTSLRPTTLGIYDLPTNFRKSRPNAVTVAEHFRKHGYRTEAMGKIFHVGHGNHEDSASWSVPHVIPRGKVKGPKVGANGKGPPTYSEDVADDAFNDGAIADEAIERLRQAKSKPAEPFFLAVGFSKPHLPFSAPKKYWDLHDAHAFPLPKITTAPKGAPAFAPTNSGELRAYEGMPAKGPIPDETARHLIHGYYSAASYMDAQLGKVINALDELQLASNTIIMFWGDHGWHLGDHGMWCKHTNYEQATRIPLLLVAPSVTKPGSRTMSFVESVDMFPTLAELAGLPAPKDIDGKSIVPTLRDPMVKGDGHAYHCYPRGANIGRAIRTDRYRLVEWKKPGETTAEFELYDYQSDPLETRNLAGDQPEVVKALSSILATYPEAKPQIKAEVADHANTEKAANRKAKNKANRKSANQDRGAMFDRRDKDKDGFLTRDEFLVNQPDPDKAPARFTTFDVNNDGKLSREEYVTSGSVNKKAP